MIPPEQLAGALERLDPRERELLALSLGRRVPDEALARVYDVVPQEVARRRAAAIERLADELGAQRGEDLGAVLQALLDEGSWTASKDVEFPGNGDAPPQEAETDADIGSKPSRGRRRRPARQWRAGRHGEPAEDGEPEAEARRGAAVEEGPGRAGRTEPVLEMLAAREGVRGPGAGRGGRRRGRLAARVVARGRRLRGRSDRRARPRSSACRSGAATAAGRAPAAQPPADEGTKHFVPQLGGPFEAPFPSEPRADLPASRRRRTRPARPRSTRSPAAGSASGCSPKTEWGSPRVFGVVRRRGDWVRCRRPSSATARSPGCRRTRPSSTASAGRCDVDLSSAGSTLSTTASTVRGFVIAIGRRATPPRGALLVTDKLPRDRRGSPYGCCVLALSGHQTHLPASWPGGDRLGVHATKELSSLGRRRASDACA